MLLAWVLAGGAVGLAIELTRALGGHGRAPWTMGMTLMGGGLGLVAASRARFVWRARQPASLGVTLAPYGLAFPAVSWIGVLLTAVTETRMPLLAGLGASALVLASAWRVTTRTLLEGALVEGDEPALEVLAIRWWVPRRVRDHAAWARGTSALASGRPAEAVPWLMSVVGSSARVEVAPALALAALAVGRDDVEVLLAPAWRGDAGVRARAEGVRLLLVARRDGEDAARRLGEHLAGGVMTPLLAGVLAWVKWQGGDVEGARALLGDRVKEGLEEQGFGAIVPELAEVLEAV